MYSTCLFCNRDLGRNEVIEQFPIGRRLAFDAARGRLWAVCPSCRRWNLTPIEERWEAIEDAERRFRDTPLRVSTGQIGIARLRDGLELVRIGGPQRPEIASWRYGEHFSARRRRKMLVGGAIAVIGGVAITGGLYAGMGVGIAWGAGRGLWRGIERGFDAATVARVRLHDGTLMPIRRLDLSESTLEVGEDGGLAISLSHNRGTDRLEGDRARQVARQLFPAINRRGGTPEEVTRAVSHLERAGDAERFLAYTARRGPKLTKMVSKAELQEYEDAGQIRAESGLLALATPLGLAIEMALNEDQERRVLEGELAELEAEWRQAEEIGAIADSMFLPEPVERALARLKGGRRRVE